MTCIPPRAAESPKWAREVGMCSLLVRAPRHVPAGRRRIVGPLGLRVDQASPWVDARLPGGSRVHAIVPPLSLRGPVLTIRTFAPVPLSGEDIVRLGCIGPRAMRFLASCVRGRANLIVSGGAGSGKTTLLGILSSFIPDDERSEERRVGKECRSWRLLML